MNRRCFLLKMNYLTRIFRILAKALCNWHQFVWIWRSTNVAEHLFIGCFRFRGFHITKSFKVLWHKVCLTPVYYSWNKSEVIVTLFGNKRKAFFSRSKNWEEKLSITSKAQDKVQPHPFTGTPKLQHFLKIPSNCVY